jgi:hypothetical protein
MLGKLINLGSSIKVSWLNVTHEQTYVVSENDGVAITFIIGHQVTVDGYTAVTSQQMMFLLDKYMRDVDVAKVRYHPTRPTEVDRYHVFGSIATNNQSSRDTASYWCVISHKEQ